MKDFFGNAFAALLGFLTAFLPAFLLAFILLMGGEKVDGSSEEKIAKEQEIYKRIEEFVDPEEKTEDVVEPEQKEEVVEPEEKTEVKEETE